MLTRVNRSSMIVRSGVFWRENPAHVGHYGIIAEAVGF